MLAEPMGPACVCWQAWMWVKGACRLTSLRASDTGPSASSHTPCVSDLGLLDGQNIRSQASLTPEKTQQRNKKEVKMSQNHSNQLSADISKLIIIS